MGKIIKPNYFIQPHPKACTPTSVAFMIYSVTCGNYLHIRNIILNDPEIRKRIFRQNVGIDSETIVRISNKHKEDLHIKRLFLKEFNVQTLQSTPYVIGVKQLPIESITKLTKAQQVSLRNAEISGSLIRHKKFYIYPRGHTIVILKHRNRTQYFDPYVGSINEINSEYLLKCINIKEKVICIENHDDHIRFV